MKNQLKRLFAILLTVVMCAALMVPAFAAAPKCPNNGDITLGRKHTTENCEYELIEVVAPKCGEDGFTVYECTVCGERFIDTVVPMPNAHDWEVLEAAVKATCEEDGKTAHRVCKICGEEEESEAIPAPGHTLDNTKWKVTVAPTCENAGVESNVCTVCKKTVTREIEALEHVWVMEDVATLAPTCAAEGIGVYTCDVCGATKEVTILQLEDHTLEFVEEVAAVCSPEGGKNGVKAHYVCTVCGKLFDADDVTKEVKAADLVIEAKHTWNPEPVIKPAGTVDDPYNPCVDYRFRLYVCTVCGAYKDIDPDKDIDVPLNHKNAKADANNPDVPATCTADGEKHLLCPDCGETITEVIPALGHDIKAVDVPASCHYFSYAYTYCARANCTEAAVETYESDGVEYDVTVGGKAVSVLTFSHGDTLDPENHSFKTMNYNEPTCTKQGSWFKWCPYHNVYETKILPPAGHKYTIPEGAKDEWTITVEPTCTVKGTKTRTCSVCGESEDADVPALGHDLVKKETDAVVKPTCQADGYTIYICKREGCGAEVRKDVTKYVEADNLAFISYAEAKKVHNIPDEGDYIENVRQGDCELNDYALYECRDCGRSILVITKPATEHVWDWTVEPKEATCEEEGFTGTGVCTVCGKTQTGAAIAAKGHKLGKAVPAKAATCERKGNIKYYQCEVCKKYFDAKKNEVAEEDVFIIKAHVWVDYPAKAATCQETGWTAYKKCDLCGKSEGYTIIPKTNHKEDLPAGEQRDASCTQFGYTQYACPFCDYEVLGDYVAEAEHVLTIDLDEIPATCTEPGQTAGKECEVCHEQFFDVIPATGHHNAAGEELEEGCQSTVEDRICVDCGEEITNDHITKELDVEATCLKYAYHLVYCTVCGENIEKEVTGDPLGHDWVVKKTVAATLTTAGYTKYQCSRCGEKKTDTIPALKGVEFKAVVDNAVVPGAAIVDSAKVAVTIKLNATDAKLWGVNFKMNYDNTLFAFIGYELKTDKFADAAVTAKNGVITGVAYVPNTDAGAMQNVDFAGSTDFVVLYFRANSAEPVEDVAFAFEVAQATDKDAAPVVTSTVDGICDIAKFLDANGDGEVNIADLNKVMHYITLELEKDKNGKIIEPTYNAAIDINKDGKITAIDFSALMMFLAGSATYKELTALGTK